MSTFPPPPPGYTSQVPLTPLRQGVVITDIDMTIGAMCRFLVKGMIAAIPALMIFWVIMVVIGGLVAMLFGGLFHGLMSAHPRQF